MSMIWISLNRWLFAAEMFDFLPHLSTSFYLVCFGTLFPFFLLRLAMFTSALAVNVLGRRKFASLWRFKKNMSECPYWRRFRCHLSHRQGLVYFWSDGVFAIGNGFLGTAFWARLFINRMD